MANKIDLQKITMQNLFFELTLKGYDPNSDKTDHLIKWLSAPSKEIVDQFINSENIQDLVNEIRLIDWMPNPDYSEFDIILNDNAVTIKFNQTKSDWLLESTTSLDV